MRTSAGGHVAYLDSVRGLAALTVIGSHYVRGYDLPCRGQACDLLLTYTPLRFWWDGGAAVCLFFVLSGLVLSLKHFRHGEQGEFSRFSLGGYAAGRICRIWLPYLFALVFSALLYLHYENQPATIPKENEWLPSMWVRNAGWEDFFKDGFLLGMRMDMFFLPQAWTLSIELALSLLIPAGILLAARSSLWLLFFTLFAVWPLGVSPYLFHFMLGILIAKHHLRLARLLKEKTAWRRGILLSGTLFYTFSGPLEERADPHLIEAMAGIGSALLLLYAMSSTRAQRILSIYALHQLGKISYSLYLLHFAVLLNATPLFLSLAGFPPAWFHLAWWAGLGFTVGISILLAAISYPLVEVPSMALGKRIGIYWRRMGCSTL